MAEPQSLPPEERMPVRVLLVDGDPQSCNDAAAALRRHFDDVQISVASDEAAFSRALTESPFDLVITESRLPWCDGTVILRQIQKRTFDTPVVMFSEAASAEACAAAVEAGFADYVTRSPDCVVRLPMAVRTAILRRDLLRREELNRRQHEELMQHQRELTALNESLERQIEERTTVAERRTQQLRMLASELTKAEERERRRLAQMLHDDLQQMLVAARMHITAINPDLPPDRAVELMRHVDDLLDRSIRLSRNLTHRASPPVLYDAGLAPALEWLGRQVEEEHGLDVEVDCDDEAQPESQDTRVLLYQACRELLFNVVKHAGTKRCKLAMHRAGNGDVQVSVCDEGMGFDPDVSHDLGKGDGFGLFSIRERLELIGGRMEIESIAGQGTCVRLYAPVQMTDEQRVETSEVHRTLVEALKEETRSARKWPHFTGAPIRVLLADDHRIMRASLAGLLRNQPGIEVVGQAGDGQEVIEKAHALRPDVIVMDVTMPVVDGVEATKRLTAEMPDLSVIALSMHEKEDMQRAMREAGATRYLTKDGPPEMLIAAIRSSVAKRRTKQAVT